jgi:peptidoglycan/LPS O-acetylase OafA/YrhL
MVEGMEVADDEVGEAAHRRIAYFPGLDGVRAFAVVAVMMYHGGLGVATGGFMGVDTFFVLSGFLITSLLVGEWRESLTIKLGAFWSRRARRLLPALLMMLLFVAFFASVIVPEGTYPSLRLDGLATLFYVGNWHFILIGSNYFNETAAASPLIHTWSLAVEEQFYLVWPLVVLGVLHFTRNLKVLFGICCVAAVASATEMYLLFRHTVNTNRVYLGTDTRSQCLFIGAALAVGFVMLSQRAHANERLVHGELWRPADSRGRLICALLGIAGAIVSVVIWMRTNDASNFPYEGGFFLIGLATGGVILSIVGAPRSLVPRVLALSPIRYIGRISYGLYIWHWPLFIWLNAARMGTTGYTLFLIRVAVTFAVSIASFHLVEQPIRRGTFLRQWRAWVAVPSGVGVVVLSLMLATSGTSLAAISASQHLKTNIGSTPVSAVSTPAASVAAGPPVRVLLMGDSVALTLGEGLASGGLPKKYDYSLSDYGILGCGVVFGPEVELMGVRDATPPACNGSPLTSGEAESSQPWPYQWLHAMSVTSPNVVVLLAGRWEVVDREYKGKWTNILHPSFATYVKQQLELTSNLVTASGAHMVYLTTPCIDEGEQPDGSPWPEDGRARIAVYNKLIQEVAAEHPSTDSVVNLDAAACPGGHFESTLDGTVIRTTDGVHFTIPGGQLMATDIMPAIVASARAQAASAAALGAG